MENNFRRWQIIAIDLKKGKLFKDKEIKDLLAKDYKKYNKQIIDLEKKISFGGEGAFREAVEWILAEQGRLNQVILDLKNKVFELK